MSSKDPNQYIKAVLVLAHNTQHKAETQLKPPYTVRDTQASSQVQAAGRQASTITWAAPSAAYRHMRAWT